METMFMQNFWGQTLSIMESLKVTCSRPILSPRKQRKPQKSRTKIHISAPLHRTTWIEKPSSLIQLFWPSTADITIRYKTSSITFKLGVDKLEQSGTTVYTEYCQNWDRKNLSGKIPVSRCNFILRWPNKVSPRSAVMCKSKTNS